MANVLVLLVSLLLVMDSASQTSIETVMYECKGQKNLTVLQSFDVVSKFSCAFVCNSRSDCIAFYFGEDSRGFPMCQLYSRSTGQSSMSATDDGSDGRLVFICNQISIIPCSCLNGGTCLPTILSCMCPSEFTGQQCEQGSTSTNSASTATSTDGPTTTVSTMRTATTAISVSTTPVRLFLWLLSPLASYTSSKSTCTDNASVLIRVRDAATQDTIERKARNMTEVTADLWIGLKMKANGPLIWEDGLYYNSSQYSNWSPTAKPNATYTVAKCVSLNKTLGFKWDLRSCSDLCQAICDDL